MGVSSTTIPRWRKRRKLDTFIVCIVARKQRETRVSIIGARARATGSGIKFESRRKLFRSVAMSTAALSNKFRMWWVKRLDDKTWHRCSTKLAKCPNFHLLPLSLSLSLFLSLFLSVLSVPFTKFANLTRIRLQVRRQSGVSASERGKRAVTTGEFRKRASIVEFTF